MAEFLRWLTSDDVYPWVMGMLGLLVLVLFRLWALVRRLRDAGVALVVDDPTPEEPDRDMMAVAEHLDVDPEPTFTAVKSGWYQIGGSIRPGTDRTEVTFIAEPEPTARYEPCGHRWHSTGDDCAGDCGGHRCTRLPGGHHRHTCACGARSDQGPVLVIDPPTVPAYMSTGWHPDEPEQWVTFGTVRVHQKCMDARRDGRPELIVDGCRPHLVGAAQPTGGA